MISRKYILLVCLALWSVGAMATTQLASQPTAIQPMETGMKSTSAFLAPKTAVVSRGSAAAVSAARADLGSRNMVFSPLHTTATSKKRTVCASQFAVSTEVQLPAVSISSRNMDDVISSSAASTPTIVTSPGPRKVGPGGGSLPPDPYMVPVGELPFVLLALLAAMYAVYCAMIKKKETK